MKPNGIDRQSIMECRGHAARLRQQASLAKSPSERAEFEKVAIQYDALVAEMEMFEIRMQSSG